LDYLRTNIIFAILINGIDKDTTAGECGKSGLK
jgi:hypothetical protein